MFLNHFNINGARLAIGTPEVDNFKALYLIWAAKKNTT